MSGEHAVLYSLALYCLSVLLPIIPAAVMFKLFPDTTARARHRADPAAILELGAASAQLKTWLEGLKQ
jgi:hypothetical protein